MTVILAVPGCCRKPRRGGWVTKWVAEEVPGWGARGGQWGRPHFNQGRGPLGLGGEDVGCMRVTAGRQGKGGWWVWVCGCVCVRVQAQGGHVQAKKDGMGLLQQLGVTFLGGSQQRRVKMAVLRLQGCCNWSQVRAGFQAPQMTGLQFTVFSNVATSS